VPSEGRRCGGIGQLLDDLQLLDDRAGPPVGGDQRQRVLVPGAGVEEMKLQPVDLGDEVRQGVQLRPAPAPVVVCPPVARELLRHRQRHALEVIGDRLVLGQPGRVDAPAQLGELRFGKPTWNARTTVLPLLVCCAASVMARFLRPVD
jgi:hypothetical protein